MYRVLKTTGSIYLQMDCRISHWLRCILDDIFGYGRFKNEIIYRRSLGNNSKYHHYVKNNDRILFYVKSSNYTFNHAYTPLSSESIKRYNKVDTKGERYCLTQTYDTNNYREGYENDFRVVGNEKFYVKQGMYFSISQKEIDKRISQGIIFERNTEGGLAYRRYMKDSKGVRLSEYWGDLPLCEGYKAQYDTQKPIELLERIIKVSSNEGDVVADFFCGSGTTLAAAKKLGRYYIGCDINPKAIEIAKERININTNLFSV
jgi:DNA modification methylase